MGSDVKWHNNYWQKAIQSSELSVTKKIADLIEQYPESFDCVFLDVTDTKAIHQSLKEAVEKNGTIDVVVNNAGYGLFGATEELSDEQVEQNIATNLTGSIQMICSVVSFLRKQRSWKEHPNFFLWQSNSFSWELYVPHY